MALSRAQIKFLQSLKQKKYRQRYNKFAVEGEKIALELLREAPGEIDALYALPDWIREHEVLLGDAGVTPEPLSPEDLARISSLQTPNRVYVLTGMGPPAPDPARVSRDLSLYLDGVQDPGNLGTILRIADWFGLAAVFCAPHCVEWANPKVIQASMGAFFRTPVAYLPLPDLLAQYPELPVWGTAMDGQSVYQAPFSAKALIVVGSESHGVSEETARQIGHWMGIPAYGPGGSESLNAAVATGIVCAVIRGRSLGMGPLTD
jgi:TrmH family RNA methyltransferase